MGLLDRLERLLGLGKAAGAQSAGQAAEVEPSFEESARQDPVLVKVLTGEMSMPLIGGYNSQIRLIDKLLKKMGYTGDIQSNLAEFQKLVGIDSPKGQVVGQRTLQALIVASRAGKNWKIAVASRELRLNPPPVSSQSRVNEARALLGNLQRLETRKAIYYTSDGKLNHNIETRAYQLSDSAVPLQGGDVDEEAIMRAYILLGVMKKGELLTTGNYRFQILSGVSQNPGLQKKFGAGTYDALTKALNAVAAGTDWLPVDSQRLIGQFDR